VRCQASKKSYNIILESICHYIENKKDYIKEGQSQSDELELLTDKAEFNDILRFIFSSEYEKVRSKAKDIVDMLISLQGESARLLFESTMENLKNIISGTYVSKRGEELTSHYSVLPHRMLSLLFTTDILARELSRFSPFASAVALFANLKASNVTVKIGYRVDDIPVFHRVITELIKKNVSARNYSIALKDLFNESERISKMGNKILSEPEKSELFDLICASNRDKLSETIYNLTMSPKLTRYIVELLITSGSSLKSVSMRDEALKKFLNAMLVNLGILEYEVYSMALDLDLPAMLRIELEEKEGEFSSRWSGEADLVIANGSDTYIIEVTSRNQLNERKIENLETLYNFIDCKEIYIISDISSEEILDKLNRSYIKLISPESTFGMLKNIAYGCEI
jgi:hypothetical protein